MSELEHAKSLLATNNFTCVLCKGEAICTSRERGVRPLVEWLESGKDLRGCSAADKVVGRATAFLYVLLGAAAVYAKVISHSAKEVLSTHGILVECDAEVEHIINRKGDGICPFEAAVLAVENAKDAYEVIRHTMTSLHIT